MKTPLLLTALAVVGAATSLTFSPEVPASISHPAIGGTRAVGFIVAGSVTEEGTGQPVAAVVRVAGTPQAVQARRNGTYILDIPESQTRAGHVDLVVEAQGYQSARRTLRVQGTSVRADFALSPVARGTEPQSEQEERRPAQEALRQLRTRIGQASGQRLMNASADMAAPLPYAAPAMAGPTRAADPAHRMDPEHNREGYEHLTENPFLPVASAPLSTFSIDVDRASYANIRRFIEQGQRPPVDAVRIEEMINYFTYDYDDVRGGDPFEVHTEVARAPWQHDHRLVKIGIQGERLDLSETPPNNLVFLLDVSGSMHSPDKLPLLQKAFSMLVDELRPEDRVAIVVYAGAAGLVLESTPGDEKGTILEAIDALQAGGSTAGGAGLRLAYDVARRNHIEGGNNRVILATDGDFNVGESSDGAMVRLIEEKREQGTFLTVLGFGTGNLQDAKMEQISNHGNGNYAYIDSELEARKVLVNELGGTLVTIAKDVKIQVEFNPERVQAYRLIGYENRLLAAEDFNDDTKDAGELGAGHTVTALYEVVPVGVEFETRDVDGLRYQRPAETSVRSDSEELMFVKLRYKEPTGSRSRLIEHPVRDRVRNASADLRWAAAVAGFGMILRESEHCGGFSIQDVLALARGAQGQDSEGYRADFLRLVEATQVLELLEER